MIPSYFVTMDRIPLTPNGKINRQALPEPKVEVKKYNAPENKIEKILAKIWSEVLGIKQIGIDDNFFEIGGDSIKSIQVTSKLQKYGLRISVADIFSNPRIRDLTENVKTLKNVSDQGEIIGNVELTPIQNVFFKKTVTIFTTSTIQLCCLKRNVSVSK